METTLPDPTSLIARGRTAEVYAWQDGQVLKLLYDWCSPEMAAEEARFAQIVSATRIPTPKFIGRVSIDRRQGLIYERVEGSEMLEQLSRQPWQVTTLARQMAELHAEVHHEPGAGFRPLRLALRATLERVTGLPPQVETGVLAALDRLPDGEALCHFDFHPGQIMITASGPVVLDWLTGRQGDPTGAVTRTSSVWVSHSFDQCLFYDGQSLIEHHLGDAYPRYLVFGRDHSAYSLFRIKGELGENNTYTRLGNLALIENDPDFRYLALFASESTPDTGATINGPRNLAIVRVEEGDNSLDPNLPDSLAVESVGVQYTNRLRC